ncbi:MAG: hypothetical protein A2075_00050 [Geobacteraceae bacterium GWC2_58_44]|nr:MAG: hypothetical protein A2075_00050 [Geobacteraceae bacterium GWC2_58_44]
MGLRTKLFSPLLLAIILLVAYTYALWLPRVLADAENAYQNSVKIHLESVAEGLVPLVLGNQLDSVYGNLDALLGKNADWVSVELFDPVGRLLYPLDASRLSKGDERHDIRTLPQEVRYLDEKLGILEVKVDFTRMLNEIRERAIVLICTFLAVLLLFLAATGFLLDYLVRKPIRHLADASQRLANGDFGMPLPKPDNDEVGILINSFAGMRDAIRVDTERLFDTNEELRREIAERKQAEEALRRTQEELVRNEKLAVLGQLSGSVGHELRTPLGVMSNAVYFLKTVLADAGETTCEYLEIIKEEIHTSQRIITDLLDFARTKTPQVKAVTAWELVNESLGRCVIPECVQVHADLPDTLPRVNVDPLQMGQVLQNLVTNGVQAMPDGGALLISARGVSGSNSELKTQNPKLDGDFIEISVADTGEGISPENMDKLFQPLFTTKAKGIGLGLVVCRHLTEANGGRIEVESRIGEGTTFAVILPAGEGGTWTES